MTPRQARTERRTAERKAKKLERKAIKSGFVSQELPDPSKRTEINRANSQHSTGPRSPAGKLASSRNAVKHGLASGHMIIPGEDTAAFEALLGALLEEHQPANATEELLINELAQSYWLSQRAIRFQNECFTEAGVDEERTGRSLPVVRVTEKRLALFLRYQTTHERSFHKALNTLMKLQKERRKAEAGFVSHEPPKQSPKRSDGRPETGFVPQTDTNARVIQNQKAA